MTKAIVLNYQCLKKALFTINVLDKKRQQNKQCTSSLVLNIALVPPASLGKGVSKERRAGGDRVSTRQTRMSLHSARIVGERKAVPLIGTKVEKIHIVQ
ncbi:hypothetical protein [Vibrio parahaemolyticus]|uniref:Uncharacterized protein n=1 Tax=Vibrio parahaemolyticus TaxID=670 RepID=A0AAW3ILR5_VIBPH|nr:hypothetical protein [Vibrio parahaemolyticus]EHR1200225.1 hypothetical protein [Vibrio parahaemolyticus]EHR5852796.1 hypothetical protein [Vibrio parahaemolyticus]KOY18714.1 hypothetical protein ACX05_26960 [Vibrio parahaemolyticus]KOY38463.1 hypothetical protein ACX10_11735 [Vibrio parahaemolyticus]